MYFQTNIEYIFVLTSGKELLISFSEENDVYEEEKFYDFENFECYDNDDNRYICYVNESDNKYIVLKSRDISGSTTSHEVHKIILNNKIIYYKEEDDE